MIIYTEKLCPNTKNVRESLPLLYVTLTLYWWPPYVGSDQTAF